jgi:hypothetical protein
VFLTAKKQSDILYKIIYDKFRRKAGGFGEKMYEML